MFNANRPTLDELPSTRQLLRSTLIAFVVAIVLLVTVVMPAEYAIDPTGAGRLLGMTQMGETKAVLSAEAAAEAAMSVAAVDETRAPAEVLAPVVGEIVPAAQEVSVRQDEITITLTPGQGAEVKVEMKKGAQVTYHWTVNGGVVNYDTHGDPYDMPRDFYHGYGKGKQTPEDRGTLTAAFDGHHGWFWRNRGDKPVSVTLRVGGDYIDFKRVI